MAKKKIGPIPHDSVFRMFRTESDRAAAVLGGAYLETTLDHLLHGWLITDKDVSRLFANAAQKVHLAFALGVISDASRRDALRLLAIRNHFAHNVEDATFDDPEVVECLRNIDCGASRRGERRRQPQGNRSRYIQGVTYMAGMFASFMLDDRGDDVKRQEAMMILMARGIARAEIEQELAYRSSRRGSGGTGTPRAAP